MIALLVLAVIVTAAVTLFAVSRQAAAAEVELRKRHAERRRRFEALAVAARRTAEGDDRGRRHYEQDPAR